MVGGGQDLFITGGSVRLTDNNTWVDNDPSRAGRWGGASLELSGTGAIQHYGGKGLRVGERGSGVFTQTGGSHFLTASGASGNVNLRVGSQNGGGSGTYNMSGGLLTNTGVAPGFTAAGGNGGVSVGRGGTGVLTVSGLAEIDLTAASTSGGASLSLHGTNQLPGSSVLNVIGSGATINLHSLLLSGINPGENTINFDLFGGSDVSTIDVLGVFADATSGESVTLGGADIFLSNYAGVTTTTTLDLIDAANGFEILGPGFSLDAASALDGWNLAIVNGAGSQQILQASFTAVPEPGSAMVLCVGGIFAAGRRRRRSYKTSASWPCV